jgi:two-component system KDP operon response regulator KdpE
LKISAQADDKNAYLIFHLLQDGDAAERIWTYINSDRLGYIDPGTSSVAYQHAKKIIEAQGGRIKLETPGEEGAGSKLIITFPILPEIATSETVDEEIIPPDRISGHILIVEKEPDYQALFRTLIEGNGFRFDLCASGKTAVNILDSTSVDLILISEELEDMHGINLLQSIRRYSDVPIIVIGDSTDSDLMVNVFNLGADDFVSKPINSNELIARVQSHIRRKIRSVKKVDSDADRFTVNGLTIDLKARQVWKSGKEIELTIKEFGLIALLVKNQGRVLSYKNIIQTLWEPGKGSRHALSVHVSRLRQKVETNPQNPKLILTKWGAGYFIKQSKNI